MQEFEEIQTTTTSKRLKHITCELCKKQSNNPNWGSGYAIRQTTVECDDYKSYPSDAYGEKYQIDICPDCFIDKLIPWVVAQGGQVTRIEID